MGFDGTFEGEIAGEKKFYGRESEEGKFVSNLIEKRNCYIVPRKSLQAETAFIVRGREEGIPGSTIGTSPACCEIEAYLAWISALLLIASKLGVVSLTV